MGRKIRKSWGEKSGKVGEKNQEKLGRIGGRKVLKNKNLPEAVARVLKVRINNWINGFRRDRHIFVWDDEG